MLWDNATDWFDVLELLPNNVQCSMKYQLCLYYWYVSIEYYYMIFFMNLYVYLENYVYNSYMFNRAHTPFHGTFRSISMKTIEYVMYMSTTVQYACFIPAKTLHNSDTDSVHFNHFYCMGICDKLSRHLLILTYIYLNLDECWLTSLMP